MKASIPFGKKIAAVAFAALAMGAGLTMNAGEAEARNGRKGALIAAGILGALAVGAIAAQANETRHGGLYVDDVETFDGIHAPADHWQRSFFRQPEHYHPGYHPYPGHGYRHHRRYRITEGAEEIQMRKVGAYLFGYLGPRRALFAK